MIDHALERLMQAAADAFDADTAEYDSSAVRVGVDLGTAHIAILALDRDGRALAGAYEPASVLQDGVVVDYMGACETLRRLTHQIERKLGAAILQAHGAYPPGVGSAEQRIVSHVIESAGMNCSGLVDEPSAANAVLRIDNGAIVDVGGGTTGVAVINDGAVVHTVDEPTGGRHLTLVVAGGQGLSVEDAERMKRDPAEQERLAPALRPVMEKVASIVESAIRGRGVQMIHLMGGAVMIDGFAEVVAEFNGIHTQIPAHPLLVTPLGIARSAPAATTAALPTIGAHHHG